MTRRSDKLNFLKTTRKSLENKHYLDLLTEADGLGLSTEGGRDRILDRYFRFIVRKRFGQQEAPWYPEIDNKMALEHTPPGQNSELRPNQQNDQQQLQAVAGATAQQENVNAENPAENGAKKKDLPIKKNIGKNRTLGVIAHEDLALPKELKYTPTQQHKMNKIS